MKTLLKALVTVAFILSLSSCKGAPVNPPEKYFTGKQLELANLINTADADAVYAMAKAMPLEELNAFGKDKMTILLYAMQKPPKEEKWYPVMTSLMKAGADPQQVGYMETSYLSVARSVTKTENNIELLRAALKAGVNPDADIDKDPAGPLIGYVAGQGGLPAMKLLVEYGADVNRRDTGGGSALSDSISTLGLDEVMFLLDKGANPKVVDYYGESFAYYVWQAVNTLTENKDPRLPKAQAIRDRIIKMGVKWPPESPEQFRARAKAEHKAKTGKDFIFIPEDGWQNAENIPKYVPVPVWKVAPREGMQ